ncbi:hypothetical protein Tco_1085712, partial [Tanacetum coccineum]
MRALPTNNPVVYFNFLVKSTTPTVVALSDIPNIALDVVIDGIVVLIPTIPLTSTLAAYLDYNRGKEVPRPALRVVILGGIIYTREDMGNV